MILATASGVALGAASNPKPGKNYFSKKPNVSISIGKPAKYVTVFVSCFTSPGIGDDWSSGKIALKQNAFKYDKRTKIGTENGATFGTVEGQLLVTGKFRGGKFSGTMLIGGSTCAKANYTAKLNTSVGHGGT
jgi:hypothetical protein